MKTFRITGSIALLYSIYNGLGFLNYLKNPGISIDVGVLTVAVFLIYFILAIIFLFIPKNKENSLIKKSAHLSIFLPFIVLLFSYSVLGLGLADSNYLRPILVLILLIPLCFAIRGILKKDNIISSANKPQQ